MDKDTVKTYTSEKNRKIAETFAATKLRRKTQIPLSADLKVNYRSLNAIQRESLPMMFVEANRMKNFILSEMDKGYTPKYPYEEPEEYITEEHLNYLKSLSSNLDAVAAKEENIKEDDGFDIFKAKPYEIETIKYWTKGYMKKDSEYVEYKLKYLKTYGKKSVVDSLQSNISGLHTLKKNGYKVGKIKYSSEYTSIEFKKKGFGFDVNVATGRARVQGVKWFKVYGIAQFKEFKQIDENYEMALGTLVRRGKDDYHLIVTVYVDKTKYLKYKKEKLESKKEVKEDEEIVGIDFGCETTFTLSTGEKIKRYVEESEYLKNLQRKFHRTQKGSNNRRKLLLAIRHQYRKMEKKKDALAIEYIHELSLHHNVIVIQNENLTGWLKTGHGKKVWHSIMGRVKQRLLNSRTLKVIVLDRFIPTTKFCPNCGHMHKLIKLSDREYVCPECGCVMDRDVHAA